jgi:signal transduction histidine kinase
VVLWSRAGGLAQVVAASRERNLLVSFGILLLLGASIALLVAAARRSQRLARQQMEFVAGVTHELRTPLAVIRSAGENLADGLVSEEGQVRRYGALVRDEGRRLTEMVEQALEMAGADSGREAPRGPVDLESLVADLLRGEGTELRASGFRVESAVPDDLPRVMGDAAALRRALRNLLDNALKYGGEARWIGLRAGVAGGIGRPEVWISVEDHGLGIDAEDLPHLFDPFYRGQRARSGSIHGSGLGLSLVRRIVEAHGGRLTVESDAGRGTRFTMSLPALREPGGAPSESDAEAHPVR